MRPALRIGLAEAPVEALPVEIVVVACFADERPLRGPASRADWRGCGAFSQLLRDGSFRGDAGEAALVGGVRGLAAPRWLVLGQGHRGTLDFERLQAWGIEALSRCLALSATRVALALLPAAQQAPRDQGAALIGAAAHVWEAASEWPASGFEVWLATVQAERDRMLAALRELAPQLPAGLQLLEPGTEFAGLGGVPSPQPSGPGRADKAPSTLHR